MQNFKNHSLKHSNGCLRFLALPELFAATAPSEPGSAAHNPEPIPSRSLSVTLRVEAFNYSIFDMQGICFQNSVLR